MTGRKPKERTTDDLSTLLGNAQLSSLNWRDLAARLLDYVYDPQRQTSISDYAAISEFLSERWKLFCVEVDSTIRGIGPVKTEGDQLARFSIRMLDILYPPQFYIVLNQGITLGEKRLALLHELGHMALHFEVLHSVGTLYHRICLNPALEFVVGQSKALIDQLLTHQEKEADLFALSWLVPLGGDEEIVNSRAESGEGTALTSNGFRFKKRQELFFDGKESVAFSAKISGWNMRGEETRRVLSRNYPDKGSLVDRMTWLLFNKELLRDIVNDRRRLRHEYFNLVGPPGRVPELTRAHTLSLKPKPKPNPDHAWIPRLEPNEVVLRVDSDHWEPFLVSQTGDVPAEYYVPITPVPSPNPKDSETQWRHMLKANYPSLNILPDWLTRAHEQRCGLLIFPRNPAEKILDQQRVNR